PSTTKRVRVGSAPRFARDSAGPALQAAAPAKFLRSRCITPNATPRDVALLELAGVGDLPGWLSQATRSAESRSEMNRETVQRREPVTDLKTSERVRPLADPVV